MKAGEKTINLLACIAFVLAANERPADRLIYGRKVQHFGRQAMLSDYRVIIEDDISKGCWLEVKK